MSASTSAAARPARRMRSITSGDCTGSSARRTARPTRRRAAGGSPAAPDRVGLTRPGRTLVARRLVAALELLAAPAPARVVRLEHPVAGGEIGHSHEGYRCHHGSMPPLDPLPPVAVEVDRAPAGCRCALAAAAAHGRRRARRSGTCCSCTCVADEAEGWAECAVEPRARPTGPEFTDAARARAARPPRPPSAGRSRRRRRRPRDRCSTRSGATRWPRRRWSWRCSTPSCGPPAARWRRGSAPPRPRSPAGAALGLHDDVDDLLAEADAALAAGAVRLRVKIAPGSRRRAAAGAARPRRPGGDPAGRRQRLLHARTTPSSAHLDDVGLACLEQPLAPDDLLGHARLAAPARHPDLPRRAARPRWRDRGGHRARRLRGRLPQARPGRRLDRPPARCTTAARELGVPVWVRRDARDRRRPRRQPGGGGPAAHGPAARPRPAAVASTPTWPTLACPVDGAVPVPTGPGTDAVPDAEALRVGRGRGSLVPVSALPVTLDDVRAAAERIAGCGRAHAERPLAHALGGARHRDRREVREPAVHRGLQGARRPQQAPHARARTSGAAVSSPCRPATTPRPSPATRPGSASRPPS